MERNCYFDNGSCSLQYPTELKRIDALLNKTREEVAKSYVTKDEMESNMDRVMRMLNKLETKLDKLFEVKTN